MRITRTLCALVAMYACIVAPSAFAHPLGNFTINHLAVVRVDGNTVGVEYTLDEAEIPTFAILQDLPVGGLAAYARTAMERTAADLDVRVDRLQLPLRLVDARASTGTGAGGLKTLRIEAHFVARAAVRPGATVTLTDATFPGRLGWKDVVAAGMGEPTDGLRHYPPALTGSPRATTHATFVLAAGDRLRPTADGPTQTSTGPSLTRTNQLADVLTNPAPDAVAIGLALLLALALGALHALEPGHGKTLLAVSLVGARATMRQAGILAASLTFAHTIGVLALGVVLLFAARYIVPEQIYPWATLGSGAFIALLGARALGAYADRQRSHDHRHTHGEGVAHDHAHDHDDLDDEAHARAHAIPGSAPLSFRTAVIAAMSGNIAPCPAALVVLLSAVSLHRIGYGLVLIVAFSIGLAATLTALGIAVVRGAAWLAQRRGFDRLARFGPVVSASIIAIIGAVMVGNGLVDIGVAVPALLAAVLVLAATVAYAASRRQHTHAHEASFGSSPL